MDMSTVSLMLGIAGCFVGLAGWYCLSRDDKIVNDSEWKGTIDTKLDYIIVQTTDIPFIKDRLTEVEASSKQAHKRIDEILPKIK